MEISIFDCILVVNRIPHRIRGSHKTYGSIWDLRDLINVFDEKLSWGGKGVSVGKSYAGGEGL